MLAAVCNEKERIEETIEETMQRRSIQHVQMLAPRGAFYLLNGSSVQTLPGRIAVASPIEERVSNHGKIAFYIE